MNKKYNSRTLYHILQTPIKNLRIHCKCLKSPDILQIDHICGKCASNEINVSWENSITYRHNFKLVQSSDITLADMFNNSFYLDCTKCRKLLQLKSKQELIFDITCSGHNRKSKCKIGTINFNDQTTSFKTLLKIYDMRPKYLRGHTEEPMHEKIHNTDTIAEMISYITIIQKRGIIIPHYTTQSTLFNKLVKKNS